MPYQYLGDGVADANANASQDWVAAGLAELATGGVDGVRVEVLAERLGVTKGGFYRRFKDRRALLDAMLETWRDGRVIAIERQTEAGGESAVEKLRSVFKLYSERANKQGMAIELAIRQWARTDPAAAAAAERVDAARLKTALALSATRAFGAGRRRPRCASLYIPVWPEPVVFRGEPAQASQPCRRLRQGFGGN